MASRCRKSSALGSLEIFGLNWIWFVVAAVGYYYMKKQTTTEVVVVEPDETPPPKLSTAASEVADKANKLLLEE